MHLDFDPEPDVCFLTYAKVPEGFARERSRGKVSRMPG